MPLNYQNSIIYKICCKDPNIKDIYVGSTTSFKKRMSAHKSTCNNEKSKGYNLPVYRFIRDTGGFNNWSIVKIRDVCCKDKYELVAEERKEFELLGATLNSRYPQRSDEQYRKDNKEKILEKGKEYYEENKVEISEKRKERYQENKAEILEKQKERYQENKEKISEKQKERYQENKEKISEKRKEKVECECGSIVTKSGLSQHKKTQKHQNWEKTNLN